MASNRPASHHSGPRTPNSPERGRRALRTLSRQEPGSRTRRLADMCFGQEFDQDSLSSGQEAVYWFLIFLYGLLTLCLVGPICFAVYRALRGEATTIGECLAKGLERLGDVILAGLLLSLLFCGYSLLAAFASGFVSGLLGSEVLGYLVGFGSFFVGAGIFLNLCLVIPVCVFERTGPVESFRRLAELARGNLGRIFVAPLLFGGIWVIASIVCFTPLEMVDGRGAYLLGNILMYAFTSPTDALALVCLPVIYFHLRAIKENHSIVYEADVFY
jgi:hypothetical protein